MSINGLGHNGHARPGGRFTHAHGDDSAFIRLDRVYKVHRVGDVGVAALGGVSFDVARGEFAAIVGPSGAGKSTILNLIGGVDTPTAGLVSVGGTDLSQLDTAGLSAYRRWTVGFLWQGTTKNLVPYLTVAQNAELPLLLAGVQSAASRRRRTTDLLELMGLARRANHRPAMLSGGEQQRAGLVVALAHKPAVVLADEPTAEIDAEGADQVVQALRAACTEFGSTVFMATHDLIAASKTDTTFRLIDGRVRGPAGKSRRIGPDHSSAGRRVLARIGRIGSRGRAGGRRGQDPALSGGGRLPASRIGRKSREAGSVARPRGHDE